MQIDNFYNCQQFSFEIPYGNPNDESETKIYVNVITSNNFSVKICANKKTRAYEQERFMF